MMNFVVVVFFFCLFVRFRLLLFVFLCCIVLHNHTILSRFIHIYIYIHLFIRLFQKDYLQFLCWPYEFVYINCCTLDIVMLFSVFVVVVFFGFGFGMGFAVHSKILKRYRPTKNSRPNTEITSQSD